MTDAFADLSQQWEYRDITLPLDGALPSWPGSAGVRLEWVKTQQDGEDCNASVLHADIHAGTHIDAPLHYIRDGKDVASLPLERFCGPAWVGRCSGAMLLGPRELELLAIPPQCNKLLLHTDNSRLWRTNNATFARAYTALSEAGAEWVVKRGIHLVGLDFLSVQPWQQEPRVHAILLEAGVGVVEGLNLDGVPAGAWELICLPLKLTGAEGSPVRALLRRPLP